MTVDDACACRSPGSTPFPLESLEVELDEGVGIGFSQLHRVRAAALDDLAQQLLAPTRNRALPRVRERTALAPARPRGVRIAAWATNPACARAAKRAGADIIYVPALNYKRGEAVVAGQRSATAEQAGYPKQAVVALPTVEHDQVPGTREAAIDFDPWRYVKPGKPVLVENLAGLVRAAELGCEVEVGPRIPITNPLSLAAAAELGARRVWLSPELTLGQIADIAEDAPVELGLTSIGAPRAHGHRALPAHEQAPATRTAPSVRAARARIFCAIARTTSSRSSPTRSAAVTCSNGVFSRCGPDPARPHPCGHHVVPGGYHAHERRGDHEGRAARRPSAQRGPRRRQRHRQNPRHHQRSSIQGRFLGSSRHPERAFPPRHPERAQRVEGSRAATS